MKVTVLIPAYNPTRRLVELVHELAAADFAAILVVDDGSAAACQPIFAELSAIAGTTVLRHSVNLGKGAALKTGMNHASRAFADHAGVVTVDADGQHLVEDALRVARALRDDPESLVIGVRGFDNDVPLRSRVGNALTRHLFRLFVGKGLRDTQSGLRGIPRSMIGTLQRIGANRYEFELEMLLACASAGRRIVEVPIATVYIARNASSHFNPVLDSMKIYLVLFRYPLAATLAAAVDIAVFAVVYSNDSSIIASQALARSVSTVLTFAAAGRVVHRSGSDAPRILPKCLLLALVSGSLSYVLILGIASLARLPVIPAKLIAESVVFLAFFSTQRKLVCAAGGSGARSTTT